MNRWMREFVGGLTYATLQVRERVCTPTLLRINAFFGYEFRFLQLSIHLPMLEVH